jgi:nicotinamidase-related amidase
VRDAHVRDFHAIVLSDGCAAFTPAIHDTAIAALKPVADIWTVADATAAFEAAAT